MEKEHNWHTIDLVDQLPDSENKIIIEGILKYVKERDELLKNRTEGVLINIYLNDISLALNTHGADAELMSDEEIKEDFIHLNKLCLGLSSILCSINLLEERVLTIGLDFKLCLKKSLEMANLLRTYKIWDVEQTNATSGRITIKFYNENIKNYGLINIKHDNQNGPKIEQTDIKGLFEYLSIHDQKNKPINLRRFEGYHKRKSSVVYKIGSGGNMELIENTSLRNDLNNYTSNGFKAKSYLSISIVSQDYSPTDKKSKKKYAEEYSTADAWYKITNNDNSDMLEFLKERRDSLINLGAKTVDNINDYIKSLHEGRPLPHIIALIECTKNEGQISLYDSTLDKSINYELAGSYPCLEFEKNSYNSGRINIYVQNSIEEHIYSQRVTIGRQDDVTQYGVLVNYKIN